MMQILKSFNYLLSILMILVSLWGLSGQVFAVSPDVEEFKVKVTVNRVEDQFNIDASYQSPLNLCQAYRYLTDYEGAKHIPGVVESKYSRQSPNRVIVDRTADETILLFRVRLSSQIEYIEHPFTSTEFNQIKGDSKVFKGKWSIQSNDEGTLFRHQGVVVLDSFLPMSVIEYFIKNSIRDRFAVMARLAKERKDIPVAQCDAKVVNR